MYCIRPGIAINNLQPFVNSLPKMILLRWLPAFSTIVWLIIPAVGTANPTNVPPLTHDKSTTTEAGNTPAAPGTSATSATELMDRPPKIRSVQPSAAANSCSPPVLSRLKRHKVVAGESLENIAKQYNLIPDTLISLNPILKAGSMPIGREILIPPFNGIRVQAPTGSRWQDLAAAYGVGADVLYEVNGCQRQPQQVFIPGVHWAATGKRPVDTYTGFPGYPLPSVAVIALTYGWHQNPSSGQARFHSGIDLLANPGTPVLCVDDGIVAFTGQQDNYGNLVVVNHLGGRQTRYAHLQNVTVRAGQTVKTGDMLGKVGSTGHPDIDKPHLHFEVRYNSPQGWAALDPEPNLKVRPTAQKR